MKIKKQRLSALVLLCTTLAYEVRDLKHRVKELEDIADHQAEWNEAVEKELDNEPNS